MPYGYDRRPERPPRPDDPRATPPADLPRSVSTVAAAQGAAAAQAAVDALPPPSDVPGDGSVTVAKLAAGLALVELLPALPNMGGDNRGRLVALTTDFSLWRGTDGAVDGVGWTRATPTAALTGQIQAAQIAANAVTANAIAADSITTAKIQAGAVKAAQIAAGEIDATKLSVAELSAIAANIGTVVAGLLLNAAAGATRGIRLGGAALPAGLTSYLDLAPATDDDFLLYLAAGILRLTRGGTLALDGSATLRQLVVPSNGSATLDGAALVRSTVQSSPGGTALGAGKRVELTGGDVVLRQDATGAEGTQAVFGTFTRPTGSLTARSFNAWMLGGTATPTTSQSVSTSTPSTWRSGNPLRATLPTGQLPSYDDLFTVRGVLTAKCVTGGARFVGATAGVRAMSSPDGGATWTDHGRLATVDHLDATSGSSTTIPFQFTLGLPPGATGVLVELTPEVYLDRDDAFAGPLPQGQAILDVSQADSVTWKQQAAGSPVTHRGLFLGATAYVLPEGRAGDPAAGDLVEGMLWYDRTAHKWKFYDGTTVVPLT